MSDESRERDGEDLGDAPAPPPAPAVAWPSIPALVEAAAERHGDREAIADGRERVDFTGLRDLVDAAARGYVAAGLGPGDRVALWAPNRLRWVVAALAAQRAGGVVVPLNTRYRGREAADIVTRGRARLVVVEQGFLGTDHTALLREQGIGDDVAVIDLSPGPWERFVAGGEAVPAAEVARRAAALRPDDVADVLFTSGSTGLPKGVALTHRQSIGVFTDWSAIVGLRAGDRMLIVNPFFHVFGYKAGIVACLVRGATMVPVAVFDPATAVARVLDEAITVLPGPPTLFHGLLEAPERLAGSALRTAITGGAAVPVELVRRLRAELPFETVLTGYGLTETMGTATMCRVGDDDAVVAATSGRPIPGCELRLVGPDGASVPTGEPGEVLIRGYHVTPGYDDDPEATAAAIDADGWLATGDVGVLDEAGNLAITDRIKDMFVVGGFNAYPAEIEATLIRHPAVAQAAVVGAPDDRLGEVGVAYVTARPGAEPDPDRIVAWCRDELANFKVPRRIHVVDALPLNGAGKVDKPALRLTATVPPHPEP